MVRFLHNVLGEAEHPDINDYSDIHKKYPIHRKPDESTESADEMDEDECNGSSDDEFERDGNVGVERITEEDVDDVILATRCTMSIHLRVQVLVVQGKLILALVRVFDL